MNSFQAYHQSFIVDQNLQADKRHTIKINKLLKSSYSKESMEAFLNPLNEGVLLASNWKVSPFALISRIRDQKFVAK